MSVQSSLGSPAKYALCDAKELLALEHESILRFMISMQQQAPHTKNL